MKKKTLVLVLAIISAMAVLMFIRMSVPESQGILYRVTGGKNELYILGSIHVGTRDMYPFSTQILSALREADTLIFECDTESEQSAQAMQSMILLPNGEILSDKISLQTSEMVDKAACKLGYASSALQSLKPWALTSMFTTQSAAIQMKTSGKKAAAMGVEEMIRREAGSKTTIYLETVEEQLGLMDGFSPELQDYLLQSACKAILEEATDDELALWPQWWRDGNAEAFAHHYFSDLQKESNPELASEYHSALMTTRNRQMAQKLAQLMEDETHGECFAVVGLMHLVLSGDSILHELEQLGYQAEKIIQ